MKTERPSAAPPAAPEHVRIWDPLLRLFHWLLAALVIANWLLGKFGPDDISLHFLLGYAILALLIFRIFWGIAGPEPARFRNFLYGPRAIATYLRHLFRREDWMRPPSGRPIACLPLRRHPLHPDTPVTTPLHDCSAHSCSPRSAGGSRRRRGAHRRPT